MDEAVVAKVVQKTEQKEQVGHKIEWEKSNTTTQHTLICRTPHLAHIFTACNRPRAQEETKTESVVQEETKSETKKEECKPTCTSPVAAVDENAPAPTAKPQADSKSATSSEAKEKQVLTPKQNCEPHTGQFPSMRAPPLFASSPRPCPVVCIAHFLKMKSFEKSAKSDSEHNTLPRDSVCFVSHMFEPRAPMACMYTAPREQTKICLMP